MEHMLEEQIIKAYKNNNSTVEISRKFSIPRSTVYHIIKKAGISRSKSEAQKNNIKKNNNHPTKGRTRTEDEKDRISKPRVKKWTKEAREKARKTSKKTWENRSEESKQEMKRKGIEAIRKAGKEGSALELVLVDALRDKKHDVEFHKEYLLSEKLLIDIVVNNLYAIEVNGISHYESIWGEEAFKKQQLADSKKMGILASSGFVVVIVKMMLKRLNRQSKKKIIQELLDVIENNENSIGSIIELEVC